MHFIVLTSLRAERPFDVILIEEKKRWPFQNCVKPLKSTQLQSRPQNLRYPGNGRSRRIQNRSHKMLLPL